MVTVYCVKVYCVGIEVISQESIFNFHYFFIELALYTLALHAWNEQIGTQSSQLFGSCGDEHHQLHNFILERQSACRRHYARLKDSILIRSRTTERQNTFL